MSKIFAIVETSSDVELIIKKYYHLEIHWIAVSPLCISFLNKKGLSYQSIYDFTNKADFFDKINSQSEHLCNLTISKTDEWIHNNFPFFRENKVHFLKYFNHQFTILFDSLCFKLYCLEKFLYTTKPDEIMIRKTNINFDSSSIFYGPWQFEETVWAYCTEFLVENKFTEVKLIKISDQLEVNSKDKPATIYCMGSKFPRFLNFLKTIKKEGIKEGFSSLKNKTIIALDLNQWKYTISSFRRLGYNVVYHRIQSQIKVREINYNFASQIGIQKLLFFQDLNLYRLIEKQINQYVNYGLTSFPKFFNQTIKFLKSTQPKAIFFSFGSIPEKWLFLHLAKQANIPIFCWGHGASGHLYYSKQYREELMFCDYYFTQGAGSQKTYETYSEYSFTPIQVGMPMLETLKVKDISFPTIEDVYDFIFAPTNFYKNNFHFSFYPGLIDFQVYYSQMKIVQFLANYSSNSVMKIALGNKFRDYFHASFGNNIKIIDNIPFTEIISKGKAFIFDTPSTALLEGLCTNKPVFILTQFLKLSEEAEKTLKKRAICCSSIEDLIDKLAEYNESGKYDAELSNQEYLSSFGTFRKDGNSVNRSVKIVKKVISDNN